MAKTKTQNGSGKIKKAFYEEEMERLHVELVKLQEYVKHQGLRVVVIFEGRDAAGKGGAIKAITARLNPRVCRIAALPAPTERERTQWYFQRYVDAAARRRRDGPLRPLLVQPRRRRARDGLLHGRGVRGIPALVSVVRGDADPLRHQADQVLVLGLRRRAGEALPGAPRRPGEALEAEPDGPRVALALGRLLARQGRDVRAHRHRSCRHGGWSRPTSSAARGSTQSRTSCRASPTSTSRPCRWRSRRARATTATGARRARASATCRPSTEARRSR